MTVDLPQRSRGAVVRRVQRAAGSLATRSVQRMETDLPWFATMPADQRSWVGLIAQAGIAAFAEWLREPEAGPRLTGEVFASAPREMARAVTLEQTVELVRVTVDVVEEAVDDLAPDGAEEWLRDNVLRYSREIAFAAALVYARAAEERGAWDARLEALLVDEILRGEPDETLQSRAAALGWAAPEGVSVLVGPAPAGEAETVIESVRREARHAGAHVLAGVQGRRLVVLLGAAGDPARLAASLSHAFADGAVVIGPTVPDLGAARESAAAALAALRVAPAWPGAPRPVAATALLPERALDGDALARAQLVDVYRCIAAAGEAVLDTLSVYLESGGSLEATARLLFVHPNTVRYRLKRAAQTCGLNPFGARDAFLLRVALAMGRLGTGL